MSDIETFVAENAEELRAGREPSSMVAPDALVAAAAHVEREYGYGYRIGIVSASWTGAGLFQVCAGDGSRFRLYVDRYGNLARIPDAE